MTEKTEGTGARPAKQPDLLDGGEALKLKGLDGSTLWIRADAVVYVRSTPSADADTPDAIVTHVGTLAGVVVVTDDAATIAKALEF